MKYLSLLLPILFLNACQSNAEKLNGLSYHYQLNSTPITLSFDEKENRFYGKVVNNYFGTYSIDKNQITFNPSGATMMMGAKNEMQAEQEWFKLLPKIKAFSKKDNTLILTLKNGEILQLTKTNFKD